MKLILIIVRGSFWTVDLPSQAPPLTLAQEDDSAETAPNPLDRLSSPMRTGEAVSSTIGNPKTALKDAFSEHVDAMVALTHSESPAVREGGYRLLSVAAIFAPQSVIPHLPTIIENIPEPSADIADCPELTDDDELPTQDLYEDLPIGERFPPEDRFDFSSLSSTTGDIREPAMNLLTKIAAERPSVLLPYFDLILSMATEGKTRTQTHAFDALRKITAEHPEILLDDIDSLIDALYAAPAVSEQAGYLIMQFTEAYPGHFLEYKQELLGSAQNPSSHAKAAFIARSLNNLITYRPEAFASQDTVLAGLLLDPVPPSAIQHHDGDYDAPPAEQLVSEQKRAAEQIHRRELRTAIVQSMTSTTGEILWEPEALIRSAALENAVREEALDLLKQYNQTDPEAITVAVDNLESTPFTVPQAIYDLVDADTASEPRT